MVERMPRYLWSDSLNYFQPNLRGVMAQLVKPAGYAELAVDWRQLQTDYDREAFTAMLNADWRLAGPWSLGGHIQYSHLARSRLLAFEEHVNDDLVINPMTAIDLSRRAALDSLRLAAGAIISLDRDRGNMHWHNNAGFVAMATARWRWLQIDETFYAGNALMPLYPSCGSLINLGDPYYNNKLYDRLDLIFHIVSNRFVDLNGSMVFHFTDHVQGWWQQITCRFYLDNHLWKKRKDKEYLRDGWLRSVY